MNNFQLSSEFAPQGDQPAAIAKLTKGLEKGLKEQTLLGVTGSGKSVVGTTKVMLAHNGRAAYMPIACTAALFKQVLPESESEVTQIAALAERPQTPVLDATTGAVSWGEVAEISRHRYRGKLYTAVTTCGRRNQFTAGHNVYALRADGLELLPSEALQAGDWLPIPDVLAAPDVTMPWLDVRDWLPEDTFYVSVAQPNEALLASLPRDKAWRVVHEAERVSLRSYRAHAQYSTTSLDRVGSIKRSATIPILLPLNRTFLRFLGLYIAEGHAQATYITLSTGDSSITEELNLAASLFELPLQKRQKKYDYQFSSKALTKLVQVIAGGRAHAKHLPAFWPQLSNEQLGYLLSGVYAGDGWVERNSVGLASVSYELMADMQCALLRFGIHARLRAKQVQYNNAPREAWVLMISGADLYLFRAAVGFGLERKDNALSLLAAARSTSNTNVDVFPLPTAYIAGVCKAYNVRQSDLAKVANVTRSLVSLYLAGKRRPARSRARLMVQFLREQAAVRNDGQNAKALDQLYGLSAVYWSPIRAISIEETDQVVYDLAAPGKQTFLAGSYFVHNTFTMANVIQNVQKPTLILSHNKTLAAQLYGEFRHFFPDNAVHYFVSYFDYYQPEAYIPRSDTYIEKDSQINEEIDRLRHAATDALLSRRDVVIVASVSCIYGIGSVEDYDGLSVVIATGERRVRDKLLRQLTDIQYQRNDIDFHRGTFRVRGDVVDVFPAGEELAYRIEFFGDEVERITKIDPLTGEVLATPTTLKVFPSSHYVTPQDKLHVALAQIENELANRLALFRMEGKLLEAQRLEQRTRFDLEMLQETGFVKGIENYSRYLTNREPGEQPATLLDYFPDDFLMFIDESHMTIPQVRGMYNGDRARKEVLVEHGFRLPSALDNRPLTFSEFERHVNKVVYVSATPAQYELSRSPEPVRQVIRPTGLLDPKIEVRAIDGQIDDLIAEIRTTTARHQRVLVTTLTKRMSEELTDYLKELNIKVAYLHSDVDTLDRTDILRDLRLGVYDVLVGINLLREGLDLPEVSLVAILDADKEGFLRSEQALIQTVGRAARHIEGRVIMYADHITDSMRRTIDETEKRRALQEQFNTEHGITAIGISKEIEKGMRPDLPEEAKRAKLDLKKIPKDEYSSLIKDLTSQMELASANLQFEQAAELRDLITEIKAKM